MNIEDAFVEDGEISWPKVRGAFKKFVIEMAESDGVPDPRPVVNPGDDLLPVWVKEFDSWLERKLDDDWHDWRNERNLFHEEKKVIGDYISSNSRIKDMVKSSTIVYAEGEGRVGTYDEYNRNGYRDDAVRDSGSEDSEEDFPEDGEEEEDSGGPEEDSADGNEYNGRFADIVDAGIMEPDKTVNKSKIRGAMRKFALEVDEVVGTEEEPNAEEAKEAFNRWMMDKFGNEWAMFIHKMLDPGEMRKMGEAMWERNDDYSESVKRKWVHDPEELEGNGDEGGSEDGSSSESMSGIGDWAEEYGSDEDEEEDGDSSNENSDPGKDYSGGHKTDRLRYQQWSEVKADKDDMWDVDEIKNEIIRENVWTALDKIPTNSVDLVVTSPPYWNLRDYDGEEFAPIGGDPECDHGFNNGKCYKCGAWRGQLGREPDPAMFVDNIVSIFSKIRRILKPTGSLFLNIGDTYASEDFRGDVRAKRKSMLMVPQRIYIKMIEQGWVMRQPIVWVKQILFNDDTVEGATNPTSVSDRINHTYEPMFWFTNSPDYYSDIYAVRREAKTDEQDMSNYEGKYDEEEIDDEMYNSPTARAARDGYEPSFYHDAGANIPDAWRVPTGNAGKEHPAVFSPELPKRPIRMASPKHVCANCGQPYIRKVEEGESKGFEKQCTCDTDETESGIVFEPFCGRGTTPKVAEDEGRDWITTEVSDKYADFAEDYITGAKKTEITDFMG